MSKVLVIFNAVHYKKKGRLRSDALAALFRQRLGADLKLTQSAGDAESIAREASGYDALIAVGGDGTISEVVNGIDIERQSLAIVEYGTGNGFARHIALHSADDTLRAILQGSVRPTDIIEIKLLSKGLTRIRRCIATASIGFITEVIDLANKRLKSLGSISYAISALWNLPRSSRASVKLCIDNNERYVNDVIVGNIGHFGSFLPFPKADSQDGRMELMAGMVSVPERAISFASIATGTHWCDVFESSRPSELHCTIHPPCKLMVDGEIYENVEHASFTVLPLALKCFA